MRCSGALHVAVVPLFTGISCSSAARDTVTCSDAAAEREAHSTWREFGLVKVLCPPQDVNTTFTTRRSRLKITDPYGDLNVISSCILYAPTHTWLTPLHILIISPSYLLEDVHTLEKGVHHLQSHLSSFRQAQGQCAVLTYL